MPEFNNAVIGKVFKGKSGQGKYGPWQLWNVYLNGFEDKKFSFFQNPEKQIAPEQGMAVSGEYDVKESGQYTNYTITKLEKSDFDGAPPEQGYKEAIPPNGEIYESSTRDLTNLNYYFSYAKDIACELIKAGVPANDELFDKMLRDAMGSCAQAFMDTIKIISKGD